jgi:hypothetical protein
MSAEEAKEKELKTLQCLRDHGYDVKDPAPGQAAQVGCLTASRRTA